MRQGEITSFVIGADSSPFQSADADYSVTIGASDCLPQLSPRAYDEGLRKMPAIAEDKGLGNQAFQNRKAVEQPGEVIEIVANLL
jgi:hypothetical protein